MVITFLVGSTVILADVVLHIPVELDLPVIVPPVSPKVNGDVGQQQAVVLQFPLASKVPIQLNPMYAVDIGHGGH